MGRPAAKQGDKVTAVDIHIVMVQTGAVMTPMPLPHPFSGTIDGSLSTDVMIGGSAAATIGSTADNSPSHTPTPPGLSFQIPPQNKATILTGSATVLINGKPAARMGDTATTCNDPAPMPVGTVVAQGTVLIG